ncbi:uncharacterized protein LOC105690759 isoform X3 [Athalia rosae]|uniref:uncharacterized protein LOC105690759 isoform X3 n=1 Tax=Athalia rosae TaxID=37344 RepID=UPI0020335A77|nr:uncharacterized protein LOC105690759 isoform X3 [Athalia rosae]
MNVTALKIPEGSPGWYKTDIFTLMSAFCGKELTMKVIKALVLVLIGIQRANSSGPFVQEALAKVFGPSWGPYANLRTVQLLNQLCNESQLDDNVRKDACYGCFFRASNQAASGYPMLLAMATCADTYLNNTNYGHCQTFLRIRRCVGEAVSMFPSPFNCTLTQLSQVFVNATACVLAKTRCSYTNPVTGAVSEGPLANKLNIVSVNALQVNSDYDLNIIRVPFMHSVKGDECGKFRNIDQASWPSAECS